MNLLEIFFFFFFFNCYLTAPRPTLGHYRGDSLTHPMLITAFFYIFDPKVTGSLVARVGSLSPAERLVGFEPGTFRFLLQRLNPLGHSPQSLWLHCYSPRNYFSTLFVIINLSLLYLMGQL